MKTITKNCLHCQVEFQASIKEHNRGNAKFCCISCSSKHSADSRRPEPNVVCSYCDTKFYKNESRQKISKSGLFFCSRVCKDTAQRLENFEKFSDMMPDHYGSSKDGRSSTYRGIAFRNKPMICERCDYQEYPEVLQIHHKDRDRANNDIDNLEVLCPTCHMVDHYINKDGLYNMLK